MYASLFTKQCPLNVTVTTSPSCQIRCQPVSSANVKSQCRPSVTLFPVSINPREIVGHCLQPGRSPMVYACYQTIITMITGRNDDK